MRSYYITCEKKDNLISAFNRLLEFAKFMAEEYDGENSPRSMYIDEVLEEYDIQVKIEDY